ncbi:hypothetical protein [Pseudarthrobacter polychromogenes]|uniref:hypothetical protein n=1 Tax=Pseudarthrobacter polychromogenes TaxID=1676 RepID=UPI001666CA58|nr:hypothetical protein [Pseudarthrobacter polychromogenes]
MAESSVAVFDAGSATIAANGGAIGRPAGPCSPFIAVKGGLTRPAAAAPHSGVADGAVAAVELFGLVDLIALPGWADQR